MEKEKKRVAIIGLGRIASLLEDDALREKPCTHAGAFAAHPDCVLCAGADVNAERRSLFAKRWRAEVYADADLMLKKEKPDIAVIATQPETHAEFCELAVERGVPVIVCEKPLAHTLADARLIAEIHQSGKAAILVNHERRYAADYNQAKTALDNETLGTILSVRAVIYMGKKRKLRDMLWDDATHLADAALFLTGRELTHKQRLGAALSENAGGVFLFGSLEKAGEKAIPFVMEAGAGRDHLVFELEFSCESGRLRIGNGIFEIWESDSCPYAENFRSLRKTTEGFEGKTGFFAYMAQDAVACVDDRSRKPVSSALDALKVIQYLDSLG
jgi:predicted dehydrogenase